MVELTYAAMVCANCETEVVAWMDGWVHDRTGAKVCPGFVGTAKPVPGEVTIRA